MQYQDYKELDCCNAVEGDETKTVTIHLKMNQVKMLVNICVEVMDELDEREYPAVQIVRETKKELQHAIFTNILNEATDYLLTRTSILFKKQ